MGAMGSMGLGISLNAVALITSWRRELRDHMGPFDQGAEPHVKPYICAEEGAAAMWCCNPPWPQGGEAHWAFSRILRGDGSHVGPMGIQIPISQWAKDFKDF